MVPTPKKSYLGKQIIYAYLCLFGGLCFCGPMLLELTGLASGSSFPSRFRGSRGTAQLRVAPSRLVGCKPGRVCVQCCFPKKSLKGRCLGPFQLFKQNPNIELSVRIFLTLFLGVPNLQSKPFDQSWRFFAVRFLRLVVLSCCGQVFHCHLIHFKFIQPVEQV